MSNSITDDIRAVINGDGMPTPVTGLVLLIAKGYAQGVRAGAFRPGGEAAEGYLAALRVAMTDEVAMRPADGRERIERCITEMTDYWSAWLAR